MSSREVNLFDPSFWAEIEEIDCPCQGTGWANVDDQWKECPIHYAGHLHPESRDLLLDEPKKLAEAERTAQLTWRIEQQREAVRKLQVELQLAQHSLVQLELELVNKTPTTKIEAINLPVHCFPTVEMKAVRPNK